MSGSNDHRATHNAASRPGKSGINLLTKYKQLRGQIEGHHLALEILIVARLHVNRRADAEAICLNLSH